MNNNFDFKVKFPGEDVPVGGNDAIRVVPFGIFHLARCPAEVGILLKSLTEFNPPPDTNPEDLPKLLTQHILPIVIGPALGMMRLCCIPDIIDAPHYFLPKIAESFIRQSFGSEQLDPWLAAMGKTMKMILGQKADSIWDLVSSALSRPGIRNKVSSGTGNLASTENGSPTGDGPGPSSTSGSGNSENSGTE